MKVMQRFVILLVFLGFSVHISAQYKDTPLRFALIGDSHLGWLNSDNSLHETGLVRLGGSMGFQVDYFFREHIAVTMAGVISATGGNMRYDEIYPVAFQSGLDTLAAGTIMTYSLRYAEIPVSLKFTTKEIGYITAFTEAGINPMIRTRSLATATDNNHLKDPVDKEITKYNLGYHLDAGIYYSFGNRMALIIAVSYKNTFLDLTTDYLSKPPENTHLNQAVLKIGFAF